MTERALFGVKGAGRVAAGSVGRPWRRAARVGSAVRSASVLSPAEPLASSATLDKSRFLFTLQLSHLPARSPPPAAREEGSS